MIEKCKAICCQIKDWIRAKWRKFINWFTSGLDK
jgi:hypothetical protein